MTWGEEEKPVYGAAGRSGFRWYLVARLDSVGAWSLVSMDSAGEGIVHTIKGGWAAVVVKGYLPKCAKEVVLRWNKRTNELEMEWKGGLR